MKKKPNHNSAIYLMLTGTLLASLASIKTPVVTMESMERSLVSQICTGDYKSSPYSWVLVLICLTNYGYAVYLFFPNEIEELAKILLSHIREHEVAEAIANTPLMPDTFQQPADTVFQPSVEFAFTENLTLLEVVQEKLPRDFPEDLLRIVYLSVLKQTQIAKARLFVYEVLAYLISKDIAADAKKIVEYFRQLEIFDYGKCYECEYGLSFELEGILDG